MGKIDYENIQAKEIDSETLDKWLPGAVVTAAEPIYYDLVKKTKWGQMLTFRLKDGRECYLEFSLSDPLDDEENNEDCNLKTYAGWVNKTDLARKELGE